MPRSRSERREIKRQILARLGPMARVGLRRYRKADLAEAAEDVARGLAELEELEPRIMLYPAAREYYEFILERARASKSSEAITIQ